MVSTQCLANAKQLSCMCCSYQLGNAAAQGSSCSDTSGDVAGRRLLVLAQLQAINIKNTVKQIHLGNISPSKPPLPQPLLEANTVVPPVHLQMPLSEQQLYGGREDIFPFLLQEFFHTTHGEYFQTSTFRKVFRQCSSLIEKLIF